MNIFINNKTLIEASVMTFNGGEVQVKIKEANIQKHDVVSINTRLTSSQAIMEVMLAVDAIRRIEPTASIQLNCAYFPYARQDRVCDQGEALSVSVIANMINSLDLDSVNIVDAHSEVTPALLKNVNQRSQQDVIASNTALRELLRSTNTVVVAPDAGASKKAMTLASTYQADFVQALKKRSTKTGRIEHTEICGDVEGRDVFIADDICDGGATFIALAKSLRAAGATSISLFVTHGIFAKGIAPLADHIDSLYTTDSFRDADAYESHPALTVINL